MATRVARMNKETLKVLGLNVVAHVVLALVVEEVAEGASEAPSDLVARD